MLTQEEKIGTYQEGLTNTEYHADKDFMSSSQIKKAVKGPATYRHDKDKAFDNGKWDEKSPKDYGSLVHCLCLEPEMLEKDFAFMDTIGRNWRTKVDREYKSDFLVKNADKIVVAAHRLDDAKRAREAILKHTFARELLTSEGFSEISGYSKCPTTGRYLRTRPDRMSKQYGIIDIKTTQDIEEFIKVAKFTWHYDLSAYMYCYNHQLITGEWPDYYFIVCDASNRVAVYKAEKDSFFMMKGGEKFEGSLENISISEGLEVDSERYQDLDFERLS